MILVGYRQPQINHRRKRQVSRLKLTGQFCSKVPCSKIVLPYFILEIFRSLREDWRLWRKRYTSLGILSHPLIYTKVLVVVLKRVSSRWLMRRISKSWRLSWIFSLRVHTTGTFQLTGVAQMFISWFSDTSLPFFFLFLLSLHRMKCCRKQPSCTRVIRRNFSTRYNQCSGLVEVYGVYR